MNDLPARMKRLPLDERGYPVPKFASWENGKPDFRLVPTSWPPRAIAERRCWICGDTLGQYMAFVIGPMCAINRTTSEPPCHRDCAEYAVTHCPFLRFPQRGRDTTNLPDNRIAPPGFMLPRNPGVALIWVTKSYKLVHSAVGGKGLLIRLGPATSATYWSHGRPATLAEVLESVESGLPHLRALAREHDGPEGMRELESLIAATIKQIREDPQWQGKESS